MCARRIVCVFCACPPGSRVGVSSEVDGRIGRSESTQAVQAAQHDGVTTGNPPNNPCLTLSPPPPHTPRAGACSLTSLSPCVCVCVSLVCHSCLLAHVQLGTFRDVWGTVNGPVANVHFPFYNGVMTVGQGRRLKNCVSALTSRPDVKVVTLHGDGCESFSFGLDWNTVQGAVNPFGAGWEAMNASNDVIREILTAQDKIVVSMYLCCHCMIAFQALCHCGVTGAMAGDASAGGAMLAAACDLVWTHGDAILNPHYKSMGISGSDYWTYTLPVSVVVVVVHSWMHSLSFKLCCMCSVVSAPLVLGI